MVINSPCFNSLAASSFWFNSIVYRFIACYYIRSSISCFWSIVFCLSIWYFDVQDWVRSSASRFNAFNSETLVYNDSITLSLTALSFAIYVLVSWSSWFRLFMTPCNCSIYLSCLSSFLRELSYIDYSSSRFSVISSNSFISLCLASFVDCS